MWLFHTEMQYFSSGSGGLGGFLERNSKKTGNKAADQLASFEEKRSQLEERVGIIQQGLARLGIRSALLSTEEIIEMYYKVFNPGGTDSSIKLEEQK